MTPAQKLSLAVVIILLLGVAFYLFDWSDKWQRRQAAVQAVRTSQERLDSLQKALQELPKLQAQVHSREAELQKLISRQIGHESPDQLVPDVLGQVERVVTAFRDPGFEIRSITPGANASTPSGSPELLPAVPNRTFGLSLQGRYASVTDFLYQLGEMKLQRLVTINSLKLSKGSVDGRGVPSLSVDIPLTAYQR